MTPLIMTSRLELRPFRPKDAAELHEIFSDPETHTIGEGPFASLAETAAWISRRAETVRQHGLLWCAVRDRAGGRMLGNCGLFAGRTPVTGRPVCSLVHAEVRAGPASHPARYAELAEAVLLIAGWLSHRPRRVLPGCPASWVPGPAEYPVVQPFAAAAQAVPGDCRVR